MNGKKLACVLLLLFVAIITYGVQIMHQKTVAKRDEAETAITDLRAAEDALNIANITTEKLKGDSADLLKFLQSWTPYVERVQTQSEVEEAILASLRNSNMLIMSSKFELKQSTGKELLLPKIVRASLVLEDEFARTLNWLGEIERRVPLTRVVSCRLTGGENNRQIHTEISLEVPLADLNAKLAPARKIEEPKPKA
jgi:hypothetical protein